MSNHNHINWEEIRNKYIYGIEKDGKVEFPSTRDLAEKYGVASAGVMDHSAKEGWVKDREQYWSESRAKVERKVVEEISDKIAPFDTFLFEKVDQFVRGIGGMIDNIFPEVKEIKVDQEVKTSKIIAVKTTDLLNLINSLRSAKELENSVIGKETGKNNRTEEEINGAINDLRREISEKNNL